MKRLAFLSACLPALILHGPALLVAQSPDPAAQWTMPGRDYASTRYSP